jgi:hypothetical protein
MQAFACEGISEPSLRRSESSAALKPVRQALALRFLPSSWRKELADYKGLAAGSRGCSSLYRRDRSAVCVDDVSARREDPVSIFWYSL